ncbi:hypothetical protein ERICIV_04650 (plasmid) [Paenibacillus larvae subsp. larvae]|uniref:Uncharacterized protein n=1 Tax=Paenibacillus larvae subsp. larvae TaxID=147375 RepID=A0A2L1UKF9_9BACL|nr:hypothetical protein [Paenibacillus larvae]AQT87067.1 hypothetical protein B1222_23865 [Paenibacillus larvae subsp. pulvifaciens]AQZ49384.1 hypothetical protein B5S25_23055 [Paenibacillus larvae subsp. pulvifaciens]AVF29029.1 hypothetical protein ERICIII_05030 [Paenibacillus larvae subsp. larvae]AVF33411.1 hypothetical protein ERICIV_04650 [Paenibacillus larvae subsp. larvae]MBH0342406.1 hypothetical protein [Paenibacillus larvae]
MILNQVQKKTIQTLPTGERYTIGGVAADEEKRYEIHRITDHDYEVSVYALMICLDLDYVQSPEEVIRFIETH